MKLKIKYITLIFLIIGYSADCQNENNSNFQIIDHIEDRETIIKFIENFCSKSNPKDLEKDIIFPNFSVDHPQHLLNSKTLPPGPADTNIISGFGTFEIIKEGLKKEGCNDPHHVYIVKAYLDKNWKDSILTKFSSINEYFFSDQENRNNYLTYLIYLYNLPCNFSYLMIHFPTRNLTTHIKISITNNNDETTNHDNNGQCGIKTIEIYKINEKYKVSSVGTFYGH